MTTHRPTPPARPGRLRPSAGAALVAALLALPLAACPDDGGGGGGGGEDVASDAPVAPGATLLGARAETYALDAAPQVRFRRFSTAPLGDPFRADALVVPLDLLGIPWEAFSGPGNQPSELPAAWLTAVQAMEAEAKATGLPLVLALSPLSPGFDTLAPLAQDLGGKLALDTSWARACYDPAVEPDPERYRDAFAGFAVWATRRFEPFYVVVGQRMNLYEENCGSAAYTSLVGYATEAHRRLKLEDAPPLTIVGVDVEDLYGFPAKAGRCVTDTPAQCFEKRKGLLAPITADRLGLASHPGLALADLGQPPQDWLDRVAAARADLPPVVTATSLPGVALKTYTGPCRDLVVSSEEAQRAWVDQVLASAGRLGMDLVVWHPLQDPLDAAVVAPCPPCAGDLDVCNHLDQLGAGVEDARRFVTGGLWAEDGTPRLGAALWQAQRGVVAP